MLKNHTHILLFVLAVTVGKITGQDTTDGSILATFEKMLDQLEKDKLSSLDKATDLFKEHALATDNLAGRDSLFMPYFTFYNLGRTLLLDQPQDSLSKYGFRKEVRTSKTILTPTTSSYLTNRIIPYLSEPMQSFCNQQLKEFDGYATLATIAQNTLWWEHFNQHNPDFLLKEMTVYHYKEWHLKNLLKGTRSVLVFDSNAMLTNEALLIYQKTIDTYPKSKTVAILIEYLSLLKQHGLQRTKEVAAFSEAL